MTVRCKLSHSGIYLFESSGQHFREWKVQYVPVVINAENSSLPMHFIKQSDQEITIPKHSYVCAMEKVLQLNQHTNFSGIPPEPVSKIYIIWTPLLKRPIAKSTTAIIQRPSIEV